MQKKIESDLVLLLQFAKLWYDETPELYVAVMRFIAHFSTQNSAVQDAVIFHHIFDVYVNILRDWARVNDYGHLPRTLYMIEVLCRDKSTQILLANTYGLLETALDVYQYLHKSSGENKKDGEFYFWFVSNTNTAKDIIKALCVDHEGNTKLVRERLGDREKWDFDLPFVRN